LRKHAHSRRRRPDRSIPLNLDRLEYGASARRR
jgi:hypothetical protein